MGRFSRRSQGGSDVTPAWLKDRGDVERVTELVERGGRLADRGGREIRPIGNGNIRGKWYDADEN